MATGTLRPPRSPFPPQLYKNGHDANKKNQRHPKVS
nr:MAG TPA: hypothetical protein [Caudoviricetes sp.]